MSRRVAGTGRFPVITRSSPSDVDCRLCMFGRAAAELLNGAMDVDASVAAVKTQRRRSPAAMRRIELQVS